LPTVRRWRFSPTRPPGSRWRTSDVSCSPSSLTTTVTIKAGTLLAGLPHKQGALNVCVGDITVWTENGRQRLTGAHILASPPGGMRVGFAHADTTWLTVHANLTGSDDPKVIEAALVENSELLMDRRQELLQ
jgi:hypothetical protein